MSNDALEGLTTPLTYRRYTDAVTRVKGRVVPQSYSVNNFEASIQPATADELEEMPQAERNKETLKLYTETELRPVDDDGKFAADIVEWRGKLWKVVSVKHYDETEIDLNHFKVMMTRT